MKKMILWTIVLLGPLTWTTTAQAIFGIPDVAALAQRVTIIANQGIQIGHAVTGLRRATEQFNKLKQQYEQQYDHLREQALGEIGALTAPLTEIAALPGQLAVQIELSNLVQVQTTALSDAWAGTSWLELYTALGDVVGTLIIGTSMMIFIFLCLVVIYAVTYAQVIWAQMAILILTFVGPLMIPWLVFEPMAFLFWGWFRSMITFALYGAMAGAIMRVFMSVSLGFLTTFIGSADVENPVQMVSWLLILLPLMVAGVLASLKVGELAGMLVSGGGGGGAGMTGALMMAATGGKAMLAGKAAGAAGVK